MSLRDPSVSMSVGEPNFSSAALRAENSEEGLPAALSALLQNPVQSYAAKKLKKTPSGPWELPPARTRLAL
jgi:hypothetical protein